jgi:hypothetical protein
VFGSGAFKFNFTPVAPAPSEAVVRQESPNFAGPNATTPATGEEADVVRIDEHMKLLHFSTTTKAWVDRGLGDLHVNTRTVDGVTKGRMVMRQAGTKKVTLNVPLNDSFKLGRPPADGKSFLFTSVDEDGQPQTFMLRAAAKGADPAGLTARVLAVVEELLATDAKGRS